MSYKAGFTGAYVVKSLFSGNRVSALFGFFLVCWITLAIILTVYHKVTPEDHESWKQKYPIEWSQFQRALYKAKFPNDFPEVSQEDYKKDPKYYDEMRERWKTRKKVEVAEQDVRQIEEKIASTLFIDSKWSYFCDEGMKKSAIIIAVIVVILVIVRICNEVNWEIKEARSQKVADDYLEECEREMEREDEEERIAEQKVNNRNQRRNNRISSGTDFLE